MKKCLLRGIMVIVLFVGLSLMKTDYYVYASDDFGVDGEIAWEIEGETLFIRGVEGTVGRMREYSLEDRAPWCTSLAIDNVKHIVIEDSVSELGAQGFNNMNKYQFETMIISGNVQSIPSTFMTNTKIYKIILGEGILSIEGFAFLAVDTAEVVIPRSVTYIDDWAFGTPGDGILVYLWKVYGYNGTEAECFVERMNEKIEVSNKFEAGEVSWDEFGGTFFGLPDDSIYHGIIDKIEFIPLVQSEETIVNENISISNIDDVTIYSDYTIHINANFFNEGFVYSNSKAEEIVALPSSDEAIVESTLYYFTKQYEASRLLTFDLSAYDLNGTKIDTISNCYVEIPVPLIWSANANEIKVLTITEGGIVTVPSSIVNMNGKAYIWFAPPHFSPYALYLPGNEREEVVLQEDAITEKDYDETPKTGYLNSQLFCIVLIIFLVGVGFVFLAEAEKNK